VETLRESCRKWGGSQAGSARLLSLQLNEFCKLLRNVPRRAYCQEGGQAYFFLANGHSPSIYSMSRVPREILQFRSEFFNLLNHANFNTPNLITITPSGVSPTAGVITATSTTSRQIQFCHKLPW
jgi:hypothetical protein